VAIAKALTSSERPPTPPTPLPFHGRGEQPSGLLAATRTRTQYPHESPKHHFVERFADALRPKAQPLVMSGS
jgi:hypothetical protein